jgi:hypothetical protein
MQHPTQFIPELRLRDKFSLSAFQKAPLSSRGVIVNFCELMQIGKAHLRIEMLRRALKGANPVILSAVGRDELLDELDVRQYHKAAVKLGAHWVISPDDYIYQADNGYSFFQTSHFSRALRRTFDLIKFARGEYRVVGLAIGSSVRQLQTFVRVVAELGVNTFAYPCGDLLKGARNPKSILNQIAEFVLYLRDSKYRSLLVGIDSLRLVNKLRPDMWASAKWSFDASHGLYYSKDGRPVRGKEFRCGHRDCAGANLSPAERMTLHNLIVKANPVLNERGV